MPPRNIQRSTYFLRGSACLYFLIFSLALIVWGRGERSGWILATVPTGTGDNSLLGYSYLHGDEPFMKENVPHAGQVGLFCGSRQAFRLSEYRQDFRLLRGLYSLLASLIAPAVGVIPALLLMNWLSWAVCVGCAWGLARDAFSSELAAWIAALLATSGIGMTAHIGDYSPHLLAFATYYFGIWLLFRSRVYVEPRPWNTHLALGLYFAIACLAYNTGVMLVGVYLLTALRRNHFVQLMTATIIGLSARPLWHTILSRQAPIEDVEAKYLARALDLWLALFQKGFLEAVASVGRWLSEFIFFFESPLVVILGLAACLTIRAPLALRWLGWCAFGIPLLAAFVFTPSADARGYLIYGATIWVFVALAAQLAAGLRSRQAWLRYATCVVLLLCLATHLCWSTAHLANVLGPLKTYFWGWDDGYPYFVHGRGELLSLTDQEPTPVLFGGSAPFMEAGAFTTNEQHVLAVDQVSFIGALATRAWFIGYFLMFAAVIAHTPRQRVIWLSLIIVVYVGSSGLAVSRLRQSPRFFKVDEAVMLAAGESLRYEIALGNVFLESLNSHLTPEDEAIFFLRGREEDKDLEFSILIADERIEVQQVGWGIYKLDGDARLRMLQLLGQHPRITVEVTNSGEHPAGLLGWQRANLPLRTAVSSSGTLAGDVFPAFEIRLVRPDGSIKLAGF